MHRIFHIDEVLRITFANFHRNPHFKPSDVKDKPNRQTLLNLALTCLAFREPSLDALWRDLVSLDPLLNLFPEGAIILENHQMRLGRPLTKNDWAVPTHSYAPRVRSLYLDCVHVDDDGDDDMPAISRFHPAFFPSFTHAYTTSNSEPFLPRLRHLEILPARGEDVHCLPVLFSPGLEILYMGGTWMRDINEIGRLIEAACDIVTQNSLRMLLRRIALPPAEANPNVEPTILSSYARMFRSIQTLREIKIDRAMLSDAWVLNCITQLPHLKRLCIRDTPSQASLTMPIDGFPKLRELEGWLKDLSLILSTLPLNTITRIRAWESSNDTAGQTAARIGLIARMCPGLQKFNVVWARPYADRSPSLKGLSTIFSNCKFLTDLTISSNSFSPGPSFNPSNDEYRTICQSCPGLEAFEIRLNFIELYGEHRAHTNARATLQDTLEDFAAYCPALRTLTLIWDYLWDAGANHSSSTFTSLRILDMEGSIVEGLPGQARPARIRRGNNAVWGYLAAIADCAVIRV